MPGQAADPMLGSPSGNPIYVRSPFGRLHTLCFVEGMTGDLGHPVNNTFTALR
ncbi:hypothetical protein V1293_003240 [Bradyrhizobium sp. AZCC 1693]